MNCIKIFLISSCSRRVRAALVQCSRVKPSRWVLKNAQGMT